VAGSVERKTAKRGSDGGVAPAPFPWGSGKCFDLAERGYSVRGSPVIVLTFPDHHTDLSDDAATRLVGRLWDVAKDVRGAAPLAVAIRRELQASTLTRRPVEVPTRLVSAVEAAIEQLRP
jgi:hypothetical protein